MAFIREPDRQKLIRHFEALSNPVRLVFFNQEFECESCRDTRALLEETAALSAKLKLEQYNFQLDLPQVEQYGVDKIPAVAVAGERDYGIRFYGTPAGYAFSSLLEAITGVSAGDSGLSPATRDKLREVSRPLHIQVLTTPT
jgi:alkyl hydroperoxide reductase subunit AhpF